jgi:Rieske Fe-S protein
MSWGVDRRDFLKISGSAVAALALARCGGADGPAIGQFAGGVVSDYDVGTITRFSDGPFFVARDEGGLYAMSAVCTHQGCTVDAETNGLSCACHGSTFDLDGGVTGGPATERLEHYELTIDDVDAITVDTGAPVSAATRVSV